MKALAAKENNIPFYAALPISTIDWELKNGVKEIVIESRSEKEVTHMTGKNKLGKIESVMIVPEGSKAFNPGFDVTPSRLITGIITEKGICKANKESLKSLYSK